MRSLQDGSPSSIWWPGGLVWLLALFLRLPTLGKQGLFLDEAWSWDVTRLPVKDILALPRFDPHPVLYYLLLKVSLLVFPPTEAGLRLLSLLFSLLAIAALMGMTRRWWGPRPAFFAGLLAAVSSFEIYYAQEARMYTLLAALVVVSVGALLAAWDASPRFFLLWGGIAALLPWVHAYGLLYLGAEGMRVAGYLLRQWHRERSFSALSRGALGGLALAVIGSAPVVWMFWQYRQGNAGGAWGPTADDLWMFGGLLSTGLVAARTHFLDAAHLVSPLLPEAEPHFWALLGITAFSLPLGVAGIPLLRRGNLRKHWRVALVAWIALLPLLTAFVYASWMHTRTWAYKPLLGSALLWYLLLGVALSRMPPRMGFSWLLLCLGFASLSLWPYYRSWQKTDFPRVLEQIAPQNDWALILRPAYATPVAYFYLGVDADLWGLGQDGVLYASPSPFVAAFTAPPRPLSCADAAVQGIKEMWIYGTDPEKVNAALPCLRLYTIWVYTQNQWIQVPSP